MSLYLLGINHRTAPVELREHLAFDPATLPATLSGLAALPGVNEAAILSTCNRTELYAAIDASPDVIRRWLIDKTPVGADLVPCLYELDRENVVAHTCRVACGLDSAVLGEPQILGQMKDAYRLAQAQATAGPHLHRLFQHTFSVAKKVRTQTAIGESYVSAASATVDLARQVFSGLDKRTALFIGAGEMIDLTLRHMRGQRLGQVGPQRGDANPGRKALALHHTPVAAQVADPFRVVAPSQRERARARTRLVDQRGGYAALQGVES